MHHRIRLTGEEDPPSRTSGVGSALEVNAYVTPPGRAHFPERWASLEAREGQISIVLPGPAVRTTLHRSTALACSRMFCSYILVMSSLVLIM